MWDKVSEEQDRSDEESSAKMRTCSPLETPRPGSPGNTGT